MHLICGRPFLPRQLQFTSDYCTFQYREQGEVLRLILWDSWKSREQEFTHKAA